MSGSLKQDANAIADEEITRMYSAQFGDKIHDKARVLAAEIAKAFAMGADSEGLPAEDQQLRSEKLAAIEAARARNPGLNLATEFHQIFDAVPHRLSLLGESHEVAGGQRLSERDRQFFAKYGVLLKQRIQSLTPEVLLRLEKVLDRLAETGTASSYYYLFNRELLELGLNEEIIDKVSSLLGDDITFIATTGPFYMAPGGRPTDWHFATGGFFGGGRSDHRLELVTVWVPVVEATFENGCMKMIPGSFRFADTFLRLMGKCNLLPDPKKGAPMDIFENAAANGVGSMDWIRQVLTRRLNSKHEKYAKELTVFNGRYSPFHIIVDQSSLLPVESFDRLTEGCVSLPAKAGEVQMFTSRNYHGSYGNTTTKVRKAVALRYIRTGDSASNNVADGGVDVLKRTFDIVSAAGGSEYCEKIGLSLDRFKDAAPRVCVRGKIPDSIRQFYLDKDVMREELEKRNTYLP
jgi:ectoine hydroxylase-related dioxygenase (phytanoyl-CoA dioxygenase family)